MKKKVKTKKLIKLTIASLIILIVLFLVISFSVNKNENKKVEAKEIECSKDSDCIIIRGSCCSCEEGGSPICIPKTRMLEASKMLEKCSSKGTCFNEDCGRISCGCINNKCLGQRL